MNIVIGKIGKSLLFSQKKWGMIGGDHEVPAALSFLAQTNPNINFYILGRSDWKKLDRNVKEKINKNGNIIDIWQEYNKNVCEETEWPNAYFMKKDVKIDFGIFYSGPAGASSMPNAMYTIKKDRVAKPSEMFRRYVGPITRYLNDSQIPYVEIGEDPRYFPIAARDLFNRPKKVLSIRDIEGGMMVKTINKYMGDVVESYTPVVNVHTSPCFLASEPIERKLSEPGERNNLISLYSNGLTDTGGIQKFPDVKDYILDNFPNSEVYGEWPDDTPGITDYFHRFQKIPMINLENQMYNTKYTLMMPIKIGWGSLKYYKHLLFGMIPFIHPYWDQDNNFKVPEFTKVSSASELKEKIEHLEKNPDEYFKLWKECQALLKDEYFTGEYFNNLIHNEIKNYCNVSENSFNTIPKEFNMSCLFKDETLENSIKTQKLF